MITRRGVLLFIPAIVLHAQSTANVRGRLRQQPDLPPALTTKEGKVILLDGDQDTAGVLRDERLKDGDFEANGHYVAPDRFVIDPIHTRSLFIWRNGKKLVITYWCDVCAIRGWTPGLCRCCQQPMELDPRDPALKDTEPSN